MEIRFKRCFAWQHAFSGRMVSILVGKIAWGKFQVSSCCRPQQQTPSPERLALANVVNFEARDVKAEVSTPYDVGLAMREALAIEEQSRRGA